mmetsp:Transcript_7476/g.18281  ORF Transcript_7476/g.18281 Transcript_7476/m.18281 type:complete len:131 (-) Transcript_7476:594-986(-)
MALVQANPVVDVGPDGSGEGTPPPVSRTTWEEVQANKKKEGDERDMFCNTGTSSPPIAYDPPLSATTVPSAEERDEEIEGGEEAASEDPNCTPAKPRGLSPVGAAGGRQRAGIPALWEHAGIVAAPSLVC